MNRTVITAGLLAASAMAPPQAPAQTSLGPGLSIGASVTREETSLGGSIARRTGILLDGRARASVWRLDLDVFYRQGTLNAATSADQRDLVEGAALIGVRATEWLKLEGGPRIRAYVTPSLTERWILWEGRVHMTAQVLGPSVRSYLVLGRTFGAALNPTYDFGGAQSGEAGLTYRLGQSPIWSQIAYWITQTSLSGGQRVETLQGVSASVVLVVK